MKDYYAILEVSPETSQKEIKAQYRFLLQAFHPDKLSTLSHRARAEEKTKEINEAYAILGDEGKRAAYDRRRTTSRSPSVKRTDPGDERTVCANHSDRETGLRCNRCDKFICAECASKTPVGYSCLHPR